MIKITQSGSFKNLEEFLKRVGNKNVVIILEKYGRLGVEALSANTPVDTGLTAASWSYKVQRIRGGYRLDWYNSNVNIHGTPVAMLIQYGHGSWGGRYVSPRDFINPAMRPVFENLSRELTREVNNL